jgi:hypothetical protein
MDIIETISGERVIATASPEAASCPLAIDPLSPTALRPARLVPAGPLALDPLGPISLRPADR